MGPKTKLIKGLNDKFCYLPAWKVTFTNHKSQFFNVQIFVGLKKHTKVLLPDSLIVVNLGNAYQRSIEILKMLFEYFTPLLPSKYE